MPPQGKEDEIGALERARIGLYRPDVLPNEARTPLASSAAQTVPHAWKETLLPATAGKAAHHVRLAAVFFAAAAAFFLVSAAIAGYFFYFGGNSVSTNKVRLEIQGPTSIAGGDTVPLSLTITNRNPVDLENATIEIAFPEGTRNADDVKKSFPRYYENLGTVKSGETVTRSVKAVVFGGEGTTLALPITLSYETANSNSAFVKKSSYELAISSTPLSVSVETLSETVSGKSLTVTAKVRSNAVVPIENVVLAGTFPFGFSITSSSLPLANSIAYLGTLPPGATKTVTITGTLSGQDNEKRVFHFAVGTAKSKDDPDIVVPYMAQKTEVLVTAPFIDAALSINGDSSGNAVAAPGSQQSVTVSYKNTLPTNITNAVVEVAISGTGVDYESIRTASGFYRSSDRTVVFSRDTDPSLEALSPGASGIGTFTFETLPSGSLGPAPTIVFNVSVSGTRVGQANVPETVFSSATRTVKIVSAVSFSAASLFASGSIANSGPIPPRADQATTYTVLWRVDNKGNAIAGGTVVATLPSYVTFTNKTAGRGSFSYDSGSRTVTWSAGDLSSGGNAQGSFQVSIKPSSSQKGDTPILTSEASFSGHDRFAGIEVSAGADPVTTETIGDAAYFSGNGTVQ